MKTSYLIPVVFIVVLLAASLALTACGQPPPAPTPTFAPTVTIPFANADVLFVRAIEETGGAWTFTVTVRHPDTGWEDYADGWDVVGNSGAAFSRV